MAYLERVWKRWRTKGRREREKDNEISSTQSAVRRTGRDLCSGNIHVETTSHVASRYVRFLSVVHKKLFRYFNSKSVFLLFFVCFQEFRLLLPPKTQFSPFFLSIQFSLWEMTFSNKIRCRFLVFRITKWNPAYPGQALKFFFLGAFKQK